MSIDIINKIINIALNQLVDKVKAVCLKLMETCREDVETTQRHSETCVKEQTISRNNRQR